MPKFAANLSFCSPITLSASASGWRLPPGSGVGTSFPMTGRRAMSLSGCRRRTSSRCCSICRRATGRPVSAAWPVCPTGTRFAEGVEQAPNYAMLLELRAGTLHGRPAPVGVNGGGKLEANPRPPTCVLPPTASPRWRDGDDRPINSRIDMPATGWTISTKALRLIETIGRNNVRLQLDLYHAPSSGRPGAQHRENIAQIGHVQIADNGRHEPGTANQLSLPVLAARPAATPAGWVTVQAADDDRSRPRLFENDAQDILRQLFGAAIAAADPNPAYRPICRRTMAGG